MTTPSNNPVELTDPLQLVERLRELLSKATSSPWEAWEAPDGSGVVRKRYADEQGRRVTSWPASCSCNTLPNVDNARLIAEAVNSLPELLDLIQSLTDEIRRKDEALERIRKLWIASAFPANVAEAGDIYDAIDRELAALTSQSGRVG